MPAFPWWRFQRRARPRTSHRRNKSQLYLDLHAKPPRRGSAWKKVRSAALTERCEIPACNRLLIGYPKPRHIRQPEDFLREPKRRHLGHVDHIVPEQFVAEYNLGNPHDRENLICVCMPCHGKKTAVEWKLFRGDRISFLTDLNRLGWPMDRVEAALKHYSL